MVVKVGGIVEAADLPADTGWVDMSPYLESGLTGSGFNARIIGNICYWRGLLIPGTNWGALMANNPIITTLPSAYQPSSAVVSWLASNSTTSTAQFRCAITGANMSIRPSAATQTSSIYVTNISYPVN